jgi:hypothetical protein
MIRCRCEFLGRGETVEEAAAAMIEPRTRKEEVLR